MRYRAQHSRNTAVGRSMIRGSTAVPRLGEAVRAHHIVAPSIESLAGVQPGEVTKLIHRQTARMTSQLYHFLPPPPFWRSSCQYNSCHPLRRLPAGPTLLPASPPCPRGPSTRQPARGCQVAGILQTQHFRPGGCPGSRQTAGCQKGRGADGVPR